MHAYPSPTSRRAFLKQSALASAVMGFPAVLRSAAPNSRVQVAAIGLDGMGYNDVHNVAAHPKAKHVAFCDIDARSFKRADAVSSGVKHFKDFREMLEQLGDTVDAVTVSPPDHMHALAAILAMQRGKHVYCQKPLAHTVWECRQMRLWAETKRVVTQMGNQRHSAVEYRMATRLIREGAIGKVKAVHSWLPYTGNERTRRLEPPEPGPVPPEVAGIFGLAARRCGLSRPGCITPLPGATGRIWRRCGVGRFRLPHSRSGIHGAWTARAHVDRRG